MSLRQPLDPIREVAIARTVHEALRAWSAAHGQPLMPAWSKAPRWMKESTLESVRFAHANPGAADSAQHDQWMEQKRRDGWVHGETKDPDARTHPMLIPYNALPDMERRKDALVRAIVAALTDGR